MDVKLQTCYCGHTIHLLARLLKIWNTVILCKPAKIVMIYDMLISLIAFHTLEIKWFNRSIVYRLAKMISTLILLF